MAHDHDELMRLIAKWRFENGDYPESKRDCAAELETALLALAQGAKTGDHIEDKLVMVPAAQQYLELPAYLFHSHPDHGKPAAQHEGTAVVLGKCCYGGKRPKSACESCAAWTPDTGALPVADPVVKALAAKCGVYYGDGKVNLGALLYAFTPSELIAFARCLVGADDA